jgi:prophage tail gpP-like protein
MWTVLINGQKYNLFKSFRFNRDITNNVGSFSFTASDRSPTSDGVFAGDAIQIMYKDQIVMTGWIDGLAMTGGMDGRAVEVSGRDQLCDLVDSSVPDAAKVAKGSPSLLSVCQQVMGALGLPYLVNDTTRDGAGSQGVKNQKIADAGEQAMGFLAKLAARHQVWLVADENSNLRIMRAGEQKSDLRLCYLGNDPDATNIMQAEYRIDLSQVYSRVRVVSQTAASYANIEYTKKKATDGNAVFVAPTAAVTGTKRKRVSDGTHILGEATDLYARKTRYLEIRGSEVMSDADCAKRARDEVNSRRAKAFTYNAEIAFFESRSGRILRLGDVIELIDDVRNLKGRWIIAGFDVSFDIDGGTKVSLRLAPPEAYQIVDPQPDKIEYAKAPKVAKPKTGKARPTKERGSVF